MSLNLKYKFKLSIFQILALHALFFIIFIVIGSHYYSKEKELLIQEKRNELIAISDLKIDQLLEWQSSRLADFKYLSSTEPFIGYIKELAKGDRTNAKLFRDNITSFLSKGKYENVFLVDSSGRIVLESFTSGTKHFVNMQNGVLIDTATIESIKKAFKLGEHLVSEPSNSNTKTNAIYEFISPVFDDNGAVIMAIVFTVDAEKHIFRIINQWSKFYSSSQTALARNVGDSVQIISLSNDIDGDTTSSMNSSKFFRDSLLMGSKKPENSSRDNLGFFSSRNYTSVQVIAKHTQIPGSSWYLVETTDPIVVNKQINKKASFILIITTIVFLFSLTSLLRLHTNRKRELKRILLESQINEEKLKRFLAETKLKEQELKQSENKYRNLFYDHSVINLIVDSESGAIIDANDSAVKFYGWSIEQLKQMNISEMNVLPQKELDHILLEAVNSSNSLFELVQRKADGTLVDVDVYTGKVDIKGKSYVYTVVHDVTLKRYKEKSQDILYNITKSSMGLETLGHLVSVVKHGLSRLLDVSNLFVAMYVPEKKLFRREYFDIPVSYGTEWRPLDSLMGYVYSTEKPLLITGKEILTFVKDNNLVPPSVIPECWMGVPLVFQGKVIGVLVVKSYTNSRAYDSKSVVLMDMVAHELSAAIGRAQLIQDLVIAKEKAEESNRLKNAFLANISHEIRTPLNAILGFLDLLSSPSFDLEQKDTFIEQVKIGSDRLIETLRNLIEASKITAGQISLTPSRVNINELLGNIYEHFNPKVSAKGIYLKLSLKVPEESCFVDTDGDKIKSVFINLINNSLKFTQEGTIEIGNYIEEEKICFYVNDTGSGINQDKIESIFNPFETDNIGLTRGYEGIGLGLSIAKSYIEFLGGKIIIDSQVGVYTSISFCIPL